MASDDVKLIYFCDGPWEGRQEYVTRGVPYFYVAEPEKYIPFGEEIDVTKACLKKYTYKIDGNYAILEEE